MSVCMGDLVAMTEDGDRFWWRHEGITRAQAVYATHQEFGNGFFDPREWRARKVFMRPASLEDEDDEWAVREEWHYVCDESHPRAFPVWEVEFVG